MIKEMAMKEKAICPNLTVQSLSLQGGREPPDAMSLRYADTSFPELLADQVSALQK